MKIGLGVYNILSNNSDVTDLVSTRIYPNVARQSSAFPFLVYQVTGDEPTDTKDVPSVLDTNSVEVICYSESYIQASDLADKVRTALDRTTGTHGGLSIQGTTFGGYSEDFDIKGDDEGVYVKSLDFKIRQLIT